MTSSPVPAARFFVRVPSFQSNHVVNGFPCAIPRISLCSSGHQKGKRNAERRVTNTRAAQRGARSCGARSPLGVPPRLSPGRQLVPKALHQAMLRETVRGVQSCTAAPTGERRPCASPCMIRKSGCRLSGKIMHHSRALPAPEKRMNVCLRTASSSRTGHSAGRMMPDAARERVTNPPAGTALAPSQGVSSRRASLRKARWSFLVQQAGWIQEIPAAGANSLIQQRIISRCLFDSRRGNCGTLPRFV